MSDLGTTQPEGAPMQVFDDFLRNGELRLQRCTACRAQLFPPRAVCSGCGATDLRWEAPDLPATVYSTTTVRRRPERGGDYNVAVVELRGGARMMSTVLGPGPADVRIGAVVRPVVEPVDDEQSAVRVVFVPE